MPRILDRHIANPLVVLGISSDYVKLLRKRSKLRKAIDQHYKLLAEVHHPDVKGGSSDRFRLIRAAYDELRKDDDLQSAVDELIKRDGNRPVSTDGRESSRRLLRSLAQASATTFSFVASRTGHTSLLDESQVLHVSVEAGVASIVYPSAGTAPSFSCTLLGFVDPPLLPEGQEGVRALGPGTVDSSDVASLRWPQRLSFDDAWPLLESLTATPEPGHSLALGLDASNGVERLTAFGVVVSIGPLPKPQARATAKKTAGRGANGPK